MNRIHARQTQKEESADLQSSRIGHLVEIAEAKNMTAQNEKHRHGEVTRRHEGIENASAGEERYDARPKMKHGDPGRSQPPR